MIDAGTYRARASDAALSEASTGTPQIAVRFDLLDLPGQAITWFGFLTDSTFERTIKALEYCGWTGDNLADFDHEHVIEHGLSGLDEHEVSVEIEHDTYEGQTRARVKWVNRAGGALQVKTALTGAAAKAFGASMRGKILALRKAGEAAAPAKKPTPRAAKASSAQVAAEEDIPF